MKLYEVAAILLGAAMIGAMALTANVINSRHSEAMARAGLQQCVVQIVGHDQWETVWEKECPR